jgi:MFS family permease
VFAFYGVLPQAWLPAAMVASGVMSALMFPPSIALCTDLAPAEHRGSAFAGFNASGSMGFLAGAILGAVMHAVLAGRTSEHAIYQSIFVIGGVSQFVCVAAALPFLLRLMRTRKTR